MSRRRGLTLIELVVVVAIIGLLAALLLSGVQTAREASRRVACGNNLRQFVLAVCAYESVFRVFPSGSNMRTQSPHFTCLPYLEQSKVGSASQNSQIRSQPLGFFICPSDGGPHRIDLGPSELNPMTNYVCNSGVWWTKDFGFDGPFRYWKPYQMGGAPFAASAMTRGLSNISAISETIHADGTFARLRAHWDSPTRHTSGSDIDKFASYCQGLPGDPYAAGILGNPYMKGRKWSKGNVGSTLYNHVTGPNQPSCINGTDVVTAAFSASSFHRGVVNVAYLDGHITSCSESIDLAAWRALAPRE
jgi:prepilin-type N-terminal cleavage/methylation domain-containing protein/prepilin-type processing-associated H-X9-DG protein